MCVHKFIFLFFFFAFSEKLMPFKFQVSFPVARLVFLFGTRSRLVLPCSEGLDESTHQLGAELLFEPLLVAGQDGGIFETPDGLRDQHVEAVLHGEHQQRPEGTRRRHTAESTYPSHDIWKSGGHWSSLPRWCKKKAVSEEVTS